MSNTLVEHVMYSKMLNDSKSLSGAISSFQMNTLNNYENIRNVLYRFDGTVNPPTFFHTDTGTLYLPTIYNDTTGLNDLILSLRQNASNYIPILRRHLEDTEFLTQFKELYSSNEEVQNITGLNRLLGISDPSEIDTVRYLSREFVKSYQSQLLGSTILKIAEDYGQYDEFSIACNLAIINNNIKFVDIPTKLTKLKDEVDFLTSNYSIMTNDIDSFYNSIIDMLLSPYTPTGIDTYSSPFGMSIDFTTNIGTLDYTNMFSDLSGPQRTNILNVLKTIQVIVNATVNEIKLVTGDENINIYNIYVPRNRSIDIPK